jgi:hypothetical protein
MELNDEPVSESKSFESVDVPVELIVEYVTEPTVESTADTKPTCGTGTVEKDGVCVVDAATQTEKVVAE